MMDWAQRRKQGTPLKLALVDVGRAHFQANATEEIYVQLPEERTTRDNCGRLVHNLYGTRCAAQGWEREYSARMEEWGFHAGGSCPVVFRHQSLSILVVVHGDDFLALGPEAELDAFKRQMEGAYERKQVGRIGPQKSDDEVLRVLNRFVEWTDEAIYIEGEQRHSEIVVHELGLVGANGVSTPGAKEATEEEENVEPLTTKEATQFRSVSARVLHAPRAHGDDVCRKRNMQGHAQPDEEGAEEDEAHGAASRETPPG